MLYCPLSTFNIVESIKWEALMNVDVSTRAHHSRHASRQWPSMIQSHKRLFRKLRHFLVIGYLLFSQLMLIKKSKCYIDHTKQFLPIFHSSINVDCSPNSYFHLVFQSCVHVLDCKRCSCMCFHGVFQCFGLKWEHCGLLVL